MKFRLPEREIDDRIMSAEDQDVVAALQDEWDDVWDEAAAVPDANVVWLRAQLRARAQAAQLAARPIAVVQALGVACAIGAAAGVIGTIAWWLRSWAAWLSSAATVIASADSSLEMATLASRGILLALAVWLVIAPVAVYLAATDE
jgi:hypothetical protein